ncbi:MAG: amidinotransferase [Flammeovirgaceae bacterium]|nr:amidinotransferase [Flammeovirgaceae bacterium]
MRFRQSPSSILMVRPASFGLNPETASSNAYQAVSLDEDPQSIQLKAEVEFDRAVQLLKSKDIHVLVFQDTSDIRKTDAVFPNNWISFQPDGKTIIYPMMSANRRMERNEKVIAEVGSSYDIERIVDLTSHESEGKFLEGTGSIVFDHVNKLAYACRSVRTDAGILEELGQTIGYEIVLFDSVDEKGLPIYHTNVMMTVGTRFCILCLDSIRSEEDHNKLLTSFEKTGHRVIAISYDQMRNFAGNMFEVVSTKGEFKILLSAAALQSLLPGQVRAIQEFGELIPLDVPTIEKYGGGSVRCMVAGIHLQPK